MSSFTAMAEDFLAQKRIAVAGVSRSGEATANGIYRFLRDTGYQVYQVNPNAEVIDGDPCYPSVKAIPEPVDGVVIVNRPEITDQVVRDCAEAGIRRVWMHDNTFGAPSVSEDAVAYCRENGIEVIAGGCPMMFLEFGHKCMRWMLGLMGRLPGQSRS
jgi:predicted CoA-binding protein